MKTFELSAVRLQPSVEKTGQNDSYVIYKNSWGYNKNILKREKNMYKSVKKTNCSFSEE